MDVASIILIGIGLSFDSLAASLTIGASGNNVTRKHIFRVAGSMAFFQTLTPLLGWLVGNHFKTIAEKYDHIIAIILLASIGGKMIYDGITHKDSENSNYATLPAIMLIGISIATSIDAFVIGITFGILRVNIFTAAVIIGIITFIFSVFGVYFGKKIGTKINDKIDIIGGIVLLGLGLKIFIDHTYF
ncbi:MAG: manganese efflux pump [Bacteroidales bacterium]|jgi:putative Mn2+ efflux pump MntP|nr:manganese efflux pump [Bacteroidales bacterium]